MDARNEILDAIQILIGRALESTTKIYNATCKGLVSSNAALMRVNGVDTRVVFYGDTPDVNKQYRVFVPEGNMSNAFMITGGGTGSSKPTVASYNNLADKPSVNGVILIGNQTSAELGIVNDAAFTYTQTTPVAAWSIKHDLGKYPSVTTMDSAGNQIIGDVTYTNLNNLVVTFTSKIAGKAYLN